MDDGPSPGTRVLTRVPWFERALLKIRLFAPGDGRKKVKAIIRTADAWLSDGHHEAARHLYRKAISLAAEFRIHHLAKVAQKRLAQAERSAEVQSDATASKA